MATRFKRWLLAGVSLGALTRAALDPAATRVAAGRLLGRHARRHAVVWRRRAAEKRP